MSAEMFLGANCRILAKFIHDVVLVKIFHAYFFLRADIHIETTPKGGLETCFTEYFANH